MKADAVWRYAGASVIGTSHGQTGSPCQDNHSCRVFIDTQAGQVMAIAVSDGAGSAEHSDTGSALACSTILELLEVYLAEGGRVEALTEATAQDWLTAVREVIADHAGEHERSLRDYACTLLFAVVADTAAAFLQIGDGAMVVADNEKEWCWVFWPDRGEFANTTFFVTMEEASHYLKFDVGSREVEDVAVFSDGIEPLVLHYASKSVHAPFFDRMLPPVRQSASAGRDLKLSTDLESYLASAAINQRTDDDKTLVLASRRALSPAELIKVSETAADAQSL